MTIPGYNITAIGPDGQPLPDVTVEIKPVPHAVPHLGESRGKIPGLCWCSCEECTLGLTKACICPDCPCEENSDHDGTGKEQVPREVLAQMGWLPPGNPEADHPGEGDTEEFVAYLVSDMGYSRNECPETCPHRAVEHTHLHSPGNPASRGVPPRDFILWGDGTSTHSDPTRSQQGD